MKSITASDANRQFSKVLREVAGGEAFVVISRGKTVATIGPAGKGGEVRQQARIALLDRLSSQAVTGASWTRDALYEDPL